MIQVDTFYYDGVVVGQGGGHLDEGQTGNHWNPIIFILRCPFVSLGEAMSHLKGQVALLQASEKHRAANNTPGSSELLLH